MIIDANKDPDLKGMLIDEVTNRPIRHACWANLATGEYVALVTNPDGRTIALPKRKYRGRTRLKWIPTQKRFKYPITPSGPIPQEARPERIIMLPGEECDEPKCHKLAEWRVSWEQEVEPEKDSDGVLNERAVTTHSYKYCSWHYRPPVFTSLRGVACEVAVACRPG